MERRTWHTINFMLGTIFLFVGLINSLFWALAVIFYVLAIIINSDINREEIIKFLSGSNGIVPAEEINASQEEEENKPKEVSSVEAEIIGFEKQVIQIRVEDEVTKEPKIVNQPIAIITLRSDVPEMLPVGKIVELAVVKPKK